MKITGNLLFYDGDLYVTDDAEIEFEEHDDCKTKPDTDYYHSLVEELELEKKRHRETKRKLEIEEEAHNKTKVSHGNDIFEAREAMEVLENKVQNAIDNIEFAIKSWEKQ